jgi:serine/threonine-protein kinase
VLPSIDRYEISEEIGHGGMATVYRARDARLDRWVAVKVMHPHLRGTEQARTRFAREARAVARLKHPSILEIYDFSGTDSDNAYIATELLTGPTLRAFIDAVGDVPAEVAACIGLELASALSAAHEQGIVHRDVKPENVLIHDQRVVKLTDFGIAAMVDPGVSHMTATGQILGSPSHMAPEQVERGDSDVRSDIFALGTILYWLGTGALPFSGKNAHQVLKRVVDCDPVDPLLARPSIGKPLRDVIMRCLAKDPALRYQQADDLKRHLQDVLLMSGVEDPASQLEAFLRDPKGENVRLHERVIQQLLTTAELKVRERDRIAALDVLDRVLALDDGNKTALALVDSLDRASRQRIAVRGGVLIAVVSIVVGGWWAWSSNGERGAALAAAKAPQQQEPNLSAPPAQAMSSRQASTPQTGVTSGRAEKTRKPAARPRSRAPEAADNAPVAKGPRTVQFDPEPANVTISVDGAPAVAFGPSFRMVELPPGKHSFHFVGAHGCCTDQTVDMEIPGGPGVTVIRAKLAFREARLYVVSDVPADIEVDDGFAKGRTRSLVNVPVERNQVENRRISVTAPGYEPYTGTVQLRAGKVTQLTVDLLPSGSR